MHFKNAGYELLGDLFYDALKEVMRPEAPSISVIPQNLPALGRLPTANAPAKSIKHSKSKKSAHKKVKK